MSLTQFITILAGAFAVVGTIMVMLFLSGFWDEKTVEDLQQDYPDFFIEEMSSPGSTTPVPNETTVPN